MEMMNHTVTIFSTQSCMYCKMAKQFFKEKNVPYSEKDVGVDAAAREDMIKRSGQYGVPVIDIDGKLVIGFDKRAIADMLGL